MIYCNDLCQGRFNGNLTAFADDTAFSYSNPSKIDLFFEIQDDLNRLRYWFDVNGFVLSSKTKFMTLRNEYSFDNPLVYKYKCTSCLEQNTLCNVNCLEIEHVSEMKYLGIHFDSELKWEIHLEKLKKALLLMTRKIYLLRSFCSIDVLKSVYFGLIGSKIQYGIVCWGYTYSNLLKPISIIQKKIIRCILKKPLTEPSFPLFKRLNILPLKHLYVYRVVKLFYLRCHNWGSLERSYNLRQHRTNSFIIFLPKLEFSRHSFDYIGPTLFSKIPDDIKGYASIRKFRTSLISWLFGSPNIDNLFVFNV